MEVLEYPVRLTPDDGGFVVTFPDVPEAITEGDSLEGALERAADALEVALSSYPDRNREIPKPGAGKRRVAVSALVATKLALYSAWRASGITKAELARRIGIRRSSLDRLFDLRRHSRLDQLEAAFEALGKKLVVGVQDAA